MCDEKEEAFNIWMEKWGLLYEAESTSRKVIEHVANTYLLVNLVDNDFQKETCIWKLLDEMIETANADTSNTSNTSSSNSSSSTS